MSAANIVGKSKKELYDIMCEMKKLMEQNEEQARQILIENPTLTRDLFHAQIMLGMVQPTQPSPSHKDEDTIECFTLGYLWDCYEEWSVYGVGIPVILNSGVSVTQYYVPYLSAIQIYTNKPQQTSRNQKENEDVASTEGKKKDESSSKEIRGMAFPYRETRIVVMISLLQRQNNMDISTFSFVIQSLHIGEFHS
nr:cleavage stimulating factor 64 [Ipomoea batatas]